MKAKGINSLIEVVEKDFKARFPKYPDQTKFILKDKNAVNSIMSRFERSQSLLSIKALPYNFATGLNFICFEFSPQSETIIGNDSVLVILNGDCKVVGIVDPFDAKQPNNWVPRLPEKEEADNVMATPFALARPSATEKMNLTSQQFYPTEVRTMDFFARLGGRVGVFGSGGFEVGDGSGGIATSCTWNTGSYWQGPFPGLGDRVFDMPVEDSSLDDCEPA
jgi:hypothetical protein